MTEYRGVSNVARQITKKYRGVDGVARQVTKRYRGVDGIARKVFGSMFTLKKYYDSVNADVVTFNEYTIDIVDGVLTISANVTATGSSNMPGRTLRLLIYGELVGKTISFDYVSTGYSALYSTIEYGEDDGNWSTVKKIALNGSGTISRTIADGTDHLAIGMWFGSDAEEAGTRSASLIISDLTIDGMKVF